MSRTDGLEPITNDADLIYSCDVIHRIAFLEGLGNTADDGEVRELLMLQEVAREGEDYAPDWLYGETLIRESHFTAYAQELAEDIGAVNSDAAWPYTCIDWERAARDLSIDYTAVDFGGVTYFIR